MSRPATVLVVDDEPSIRLVCRVNLELEGYRVLEAATTAEANAVLAGDTVDVLLLDVHLGRESGLELLRELRRAGSTLPVVLLTGSVGEEGRDADLASDVIGKPFELEALTASVGRLVGPR
jgi:DNA-binding response OmpR family regulator